MSIKMYIVKASNGQITLLEYSLRKGFPRQFILRGSPVCHLSMEIQSARRKNFLNWRLPRFCLCCPLASPHCSLPSILQQHGEKKKRQDFGESELFCVSRLPPRVRRTTPALLGENLKKRRLINHNPEPGTPQSPFLLYLTPQFPQGRAQKRM